jgi:pyridoxine kinase
VNVLSIQSRVVHGHVGNSAAGPVLQRLGHEVWALDTVTFSNHPAHGGWRGRIVPPAELAELLTGLAERGLLERCDAVLSGYLGDPGTARVVEDAVARVRAANPGALYACDPVIGEVGRGVYVRPGLPEAFRDTLVPRADLVTPNPFELAYLAGGPVGTLAEACAAAGRLRARGAGVVVATGLRLAEAPDRITVLAVSAGGAWRASVPERRAPAWGAGDTFAALFLAVYLRDRDVAAALGHAVAALDAVLAATEAARAPELLLVLAQDALVRPARPARVEGLPAGSC